MKTTYIGYTVHDRDDALNVWYRKHAQLGFDSLDRVYTRYSDDKRKAWEYCKKLCKDMNGWGLVVLGHNTYYFTAAFLCANHHTGEIYLMKINPTNERLYQF